MSELDAVLADLRGHPGVDHLILLGRDGLVVRHIGHRDGDEEAVAARVPGVEAACRALGAAASRGSFTTAVVEFEQGVAIVVSLPGELLLAALVRPDVGFAPLLREVRRSRQRLADLL
jgi:predicted regulator of Ras-like GTPase activity (Roadblock/LC7/MglB family)